MLAEFGEQIGIVFQLSDDIIDIASDGQSGKTPGTDLREGIPTLPMLLARPLDRPGRRPAARAARPARSPTTAGTPRRWPCCGRTRRWSRPGRRPAVGRRGPAPLLHLPDIPARDALAELCDPVVTRTA